MPPTGDGGDDDDRVDDARAFAEAMRGARPFARDRGRVIAAPAARAPAQRAPPPAAPPFVVEQTGDTISGRARDVAQKLVAELRTGAHAVAGRLDLHGRRRAEALRALERFAAAARARGDRVLLVIHGRGHRSDRDGPVLRAAVWDWLAGPAADRCGVMAFTSARPRDGGDGATLVMLRRGNR
jgi:DNA-nicking Smr family endonuclease